MIYEYHDHVCDGCDSTIQSQCDCKNPPEEELCKECLKAQFEPATEATESESDTEEKEEIAEKEFYEDEARRILDKEKQE